MKWHLLACLTILALAIKLTGSFITPISCIVAAFTLHRILLNALAVRWVLLLEFLDYWLEMKMRVQRKI